MTNEGLQRQWSQRLFVVGIFCTMIGLLLLATGPIVAQDARQFMGEGECNDCHRDTARLHRLSAHAQTLIDPLESPELVLGDFDQISDLLTNSASDEGATRQITLEDIAFAIGSGNRWQRYLVEDEDGQYALLPVVWNVELATWEPMPDDGVTDADDWNTQCVTCHVTGYDEQENDWVDDGVQCEACHGPGSEHVDAVDDADWEIDDEEYELIRNAIIAAPTVQTCDSCHNVNRNDGIHLATGDFMAGETFVSSISGVATAHDTVADGPDCISCHIGETTIDDEPATAHDMQLTVADYSAQCTSCHDDLTLAYAQRFITGQQTSFAQRLALVENSVNSETLPEWVTQALRVLQADWSAGVHNVAYTEALLNSVEVYLGLVPQNPVSTANQAGNPEDCLECHSAEHADWENSSHALASRNERFQSVFADNSQPSYCLRCHASGFDMEQQSIQYDGVVCSSCHTAQGEHPPAPVTMGTNVSTCATCHSGGHASAYEEWLASEHSAVGVDCVDCHNAHTNEMLLGDVNTTCGDCHADAMQDEVHMGEDLICTDCHMTPRQEVNDPTMLSQTGHSMTISPSVCADCHGEVHALELSDVPKDVAVDVEELHHEVSVWQETAEQNLTSGLLGGAIGVILLLGLIYLVLRLGRMK